MKSKFYVDKDMPEFAQDANNVYRTKTFIVKQVISLEEQSNGDNCILSTDTYYRRNPIRDKQFETIFNNRKKINGHRLPCTMFIRKYIDK